MPCSSRVPPGVTAPEAGVRAVRVGGGRATRGVLAPARGSGEPPYSSCSVPRMGVPRVRQARMAEGGGGGMLQLAEAELETAAGESRGRAGAAAVAGVEAVQVTLHCSRGVESVSLLLLLLLVLLKGATGKPAP